MRIGFIGHGEAARAFRASLTEENPRLRFLAHDTDPAALKGIAGGGPEDVARADWIVSAVTADRSLEAAQAVAPHVRPGRLFVDANTVSPERKARTAELIEARGARYLDMAVMAPVLPRGHRTPVLLAGAISEAAPMLDALGFDWRPASPDAEGRPGAAAAVAMVRSLFVKGLEAITVETLLAAAATGCLPQIVASLSGSYPGLRWLDHSRASFERTLRHGTRRAAEMQECAETLDGLGMAGDLARRIAEVQARMGAAPALDLQGGDLEAAIEALLRQGTG